MAGGQRFKFSGSTVAVLSGFLTDSPANAITAISKANPAVVTDAGHNLVDGSVIKPTGIVGMTELNGGTYIVNVLSSSQFELVGVDSTGYGTWISGGTYTIGDLDSFCELTGYNRTGGTSAEIDATSICSTATEFEVGPPDYGTTQLDYNLSPLQSIQAAIKAAHEAGSVIAVKVTLPGTGGKMVQLGTVQQTSESAAVGGLWTGSVTIRNTGHRADFA